ncbi:MAG: hypothetical protein M1839_003776 [Geoglossum umbratile]|nr:MAG: hypothetical protein M1839_003776 [Geoglossum umbratile]
MLAFLFIVAFLCCGLASALPVAPGTPTNTLTAIENTPAPFPDNPVVVPGAVAPVAERGPDGEFTEAMKAALQRRNVGKSFCTVM